MKHELASEISERAIPFAPAARRVASDDPLDSTGQNLLALLNQAADIAEKNSQQALDIAHKLSVQLRAAEDRIKELEADIRYHQSRADRAERWLHQISTEIEKRFFSGRRRNAS